MYRIACWEAAKRSGPCAVVANHGPRAVEEGARVVRSWGSASPQSRCNPMRAVTMPHISTAVTHTSPSPWIAWVSPTQSSPPSTHTGR